jgi:(2Fe-2S) ferredoxin
MKIASPAQRTELARTWKKERSAGAVEIHVCGGPGCLAVGAKGVAEALGAVLEKTGGKVRVKLTGCQGLCQRGPLVGLDPGDTLYLKVKPGDAEEIAGSVLDGGKPIERLLWRDPFRNSTPSTSRTPWPTAPTRRWPRSCRG